VTDLPSSDLFELVAGRRGHFRLESGYHSALWFDLDALFAASDRVWPFVDALSDLLRPYKPNVICGPLRGGAFLAQQVAEMTDTEFWYTERIGDDNDADLFGACYRLPSAFANRIEDARVAIVDDVISAGSALRATEGELRAKGLNVVAVGALMALGTVGSSYFAKRKLPVHTVASETYDMWLPADCPHCTAGVPLERVG
jgi:orotate phosphoribosyltransferase